tara:strand:+ start:8263 stop:8655 length:393 start_codon:yes stop_codon:yes gene_type:complete
VPTFKFGKIVRDKTLDKIQSSEGRAVKEYLTTEDLIQALKDKLIEEAHEVNDATQPIDLTEELADVIEVVHGISKAAQIPFSEIEKSRLAKKKERGGFEEGLYIESATFDEGHKLTQYCRAQPEKYPEIK